MPTALRFTIAARKVEIAPESRGEDDGALLGHITKSVRAGVTK
jgi:hypothetical protein